DRQEAPGDRDLERRALDGDDPHRARPHGGQQRGVPDEDAHLALGGRRDDTLRLAGPHRAVRGDEVDRQDSHQAPISFWMRAQFFSRSSRPPMLKKACSAMWSNSPSQILPNASMVSLSGTVEPGTLVNCVAM